MATRHLYRLPIVIPASMQVSINNWWAANIDTGPGGALTFTQGLSASGSAPATHYWSNGAYKVEELKAIGQRLVVLTNNIQPGSITFPGNGTWNGWTKAQKIQWFLDQRPTIASVTGIYFKAFANDGVWENADEALATLGLQVINE